MKYYRNVVFLTMLAMTSALLLTSTADSFSQNETTSLGNQSSSAVNDTAMANETGSGNISALMERFA